ncbi:hypothetical protein SADUNF_Sadunf02G0041800 [Salix dunnii]|uniref:DDE Tnp4 domain-containing protein n=1 Tax=Salix dunnii TaxID=1413687 RepID=A0A835N612_9ROSI|nr:hypothetical protein SADUNF_Sadunf02G0041800 [Salix dunnii]
MRKNYEGAVVARVTLPSSDRHRGRVFVQSGNAHKSWDFDVRCAKNERLIDIAGIPSDEEEGFKYFFRISKKTFEYICSLVRKDLISRPPSGLINIEGRLLSVEKQVAIALRRLASGESQVSVGASFGVGQSTVSQVTWRFIEALEERAKHHLKWPDSDRMEEIRCKFESWPGGMTVPRLLKCSGFFKLCENGERLNGNSRNLFQGAEIREYIVGGAGYPLLPWLITPEVSEGISGSMSTFNARHEAARLLAVRSFMHLKGSWRILSKVMWRPDKRKLPSIILLHPDAALSGHHDSAKRTAISAPPTANVQFSRTLFLPVLNVASGRVCSSSDVTQSLNEMKAGKYAATRAFSSAYAPSKVLQNLSPVLKLSCHRPQFFLRLRVRHLSSEPFNFTVPSSITDLSLRASSSKQAILCSRLTIVAKHCWYRVTAASFSSVCLVKACFKDGETPKASFCSSSGSKGARIGGISGVRGSQSVAEPAGESSPRIKGTWLGNASAIVRCAWRRAPVA